VQRAHCLPFQPVNRIRVAMTWVMVSGRVLPNCPDGIGRTTGSTVPAGGSTSRVALEIAAIVQSIATLIGMPRDCCATYAVSASNSSDHNAVVRPAGDAHGTA